MAFAADRFPGEIHFFAASMGNPEDFKPTYHVHAEERLSWVHISDGLPRVGGANI